MVSLLVDNKEIEAEEGTTLLQACLDNGIYIPNLCHIEGMHNPPASCRMCFVEINSEGKPLTSCTTKIREGLVVNTDTPAVRRLQRTAFTLLMSVHDVNCAHCHANKKCALQDMGKFLKVGLKPGRLELVLKEEATKDGHPFLDYYPNRCILCGKCIQVCRTLHPKPFLAFAKRGFHTVISFYGTDATMSPLPCEQCLACIDVCSVSAITLKNISVQSTQVT